MKKQKPRHKVNLRRFFWLCSSDSACQWENGEDRSRGVLNLHSVEMHRDREKPPAYTSPSQATQVAEPDNHPLPGKGQPPFTKHDGTPRPWRGGNKEEATGIFSESSVLLFQDHVPLFLNMNCPLHSRTYTQDPHRHFAHALPSLMAPHSSLCQTKSGQAPSLKLTHTLKTSQDTKSHHLFLIIYLLNFFAHKF